MRRLLITTFIAAACGSSEQSIDEPDAELAIDAATASEARQIFVNTEGVELIAGENDPHTNSSHISSSFGVTSVSPYLEGNPNRDALISGIVDDVRDVLAPYNIELVTERPAEPGYDMIVLTGPSGAQGFPAGLNALIGASCNGLEPDLVFAFENARTSLRGLSNILISMVGGINGVPFSDQTNDCMCFFEVGCLSEVSSCTIGRAGTPVHQRSCTSATEMDEHLEWLRVFGPQP